MIEFMVFVEFVYGIREILRAYTQIYDSLVFMWRHEGLSPHLLGSRSSWLSGRSFRVGQSRPRPHLLPRESLEKHWGDRRSAPSQLANGATHLSYVNEKQACTPLCEFIMILGANYA